MSKVLGVATLVTKDKATAFKCNKEYFLEGINALRVNYSHSRIVHFLDGSVKATLISGGYMLDLESNFKANK